MPSARPSATTTIVTSSSSEPEAEDPRSTLGLVRGGFGRCGLGLLGDDRLLVRTGGGRVGLPLRLGERLLIDRLARHLDVGLRRGGGRGIVQQAGLDDLLRAHVAALAHAGALADPAAQVVELGAADVTAGGDLDALDLRRVHGERPLHADAEGLLADREGLAHPLALALDDDALEDLRPATRALDH